MWFKLNTTFTQSLGTLSELSNSWPITRNLTNFSTTSTTTNVDKNSSYSATFTLNSGCTYFSHSVTMGGATVTSGVSYSNGTLTVNISKVTGAVVITATATGASSGGSGGGQPENPPSDSTILFSQENYHSQPSAAKGVALADDTMALIRNKSIGSVKVYAHSASSTFKICKVSNISNGSTNTSLTTVQTASLTAGWNTITFSSPITFSSTEWLVMYDDAKTFGYSSTAATGFYTFDGSKWTLHAASTKFGPTIVIYAATSSSGGNSGSSGSSNVLYSNETYFKNATGSEGVLFSDSTMNSLRGKSITAIKVYAHSASSTFKIIKKSNVSNGLTETTPVMTTIKTASLTTGWNTITFDSPITLSSTEWLGMYDDAKTYGYSDTNPTGLYVWNTSGKKWTTYSTFAPTAVVYGS